MHFTYIKKIQLLCCLFFAIAFSSEAQTTTAFYPLTINAKDSSGNHNNGKIKGNAFVGEGLHTGYNGRDRMIIPAEDVDSLLHFKITFNVSFDSLHAGDSLSRNTIASGNFRCGDGQFEIFYSTQKQKGQPGQSWVLFIAGNTYIFHDRSVKAKAWNHIEIIKRGDSVKMFNNNVLLGSLEANSNPINIVALQIGQTTGCDGPVINKCMNGTIRSLKIVNFGAAEDALKPAVQQTSNSFFFKKNNTAPL